MKKAITSIKDFIRKYRLDAFRDVALFIIITLAIHFIWRIWQTEYNYAPIAAFIYGLMDILTAEVYRESVWLISGIFNIAADDPKMYIYFPNDTIMWVNNSCSGLKQMMQFALLMLIFPGPWKHKLWFIPLGVVVMHLTNIFRMLGLAVVMNNWPQHWDFSHDYLFRPFFYLVIFLLWVWWVEKIRE